MAINPGNLNSPAAPTGQPSQSAPAGIAGLPLATPYINSQNGYYGPLDQNPVLAQTQLDDPTLQAIQKRLAGQLAADPILNGSQRPHPSSASVRGHLQPWQIGADVFSGVVNQMVIDPIKGLIGTWQRDPLLGLEETLGGAAVLGGLVVAGALAPAAVPAIAIGAAVLGGALTLPGAITAWADEIAHPTDQNLTKALVNTSVAGLSMTPIKSLQSLGQARALLEGGLQAAKDAVDVREATSLFLGGVGRRASDLPATQPLQKSVEVLGMNPETLIEQFGRRSINHEAGPAAHLLDLHGGLEKLQSDLATAKKDGDLVGAKNLRLEIKHLAEGPLAEARLAVSYHHTFLPNQPYAHIPLTPDANANPELLQHFERQRGGIRGVLRELAYGASLGSGVLSPVAKAAERLASSRAAGSSRYAAQQSYEMWLSMRNKAGISEPSMESIWQAFESRDHWDRLTPDEKAFGQVTRDIVDQVTVNNMRQGVISHALQGRAPRYYEGMATDEIGTSPLLQADDWTHERVGNPHRAWHAAVSDEGFVRYEAKPRHEEVEGTRLAQVRYADTQGHRDLYNANAEDFGKYRRSLAQLTRHSKREGEPGLKSAAKLAAKQKEIHDRFGARGLELALMEGGALRKLRAMLPPGRQLVEGSEVMKRLLYNHAHIQEMASFRQMLEGHANLGMRTLHNAMGGLKENHWGANLALPTSKLPASHFPEILPETVFLGDGKMRAEEMAKSLGYFKVHGAVGTPQEIHYRPALYAHDDPREGKHSLARQILEAADKATSYADMQQGILGVLHKLGNFNRKLVMATPFWHMFNVAGRALAWALADPAMAGAGMRNFARTIHDPEEYHALMTEFGMAGGVHADKFPVGEHLKRLQQQEDGQGRWPGALRAFQRPIMNPYHAIEDGFWRNVDQFQLLAYRTAKERFRASGIPESEVRTAAAQYANNLGGMVNPLYMNQVWRQIRGMAWFAPSYWGTFMRAMTSVIPGSARLSAFLAKRDGANFLRLGDVPLRAIDHRTRIELMRANRDWFSSYMATTFVAADMMNLIGSGHHIWDNEQGHTMDVDISNFVHPGKSKSGAVQKNYLAGLPFFRQGADIANGIGLGHQYGFSHTINDETWQQMDTMHKSMGLFGSVLEGVKKEAVAKTAFPVQGTYEALFGEKMSARLGQGVQRTVPRWSALADFFPSGNVVSRAINEMGTPNEKSPQDVAKALGGSLLGQYTGLPSVYQMGTERAPIDDSKFTHWQQERGDSHKRLQGFSAGMLDGHLTPVQYVRKKEAEMQRMSQLNRDTWESHNNSSGPLDKARQGLKDQYGLNDMGLSDDAWFARYDLFQVAWDQALESAAPETRAQWWDHFTAQWTDADYLEWQAKQLKTALAASIDGQGGKYIAAYQNQLYALHPRLSRTDYKTLEEGDPYYSAYRTLLGEMATTSPLGAFVSAFSATQSNTVVLPPGFSQEDAQAWADYTGKTVVRSEEASKLARDAHLAAREPGVKEAGGKGVTPAGVAAVGAAKAAG